MIHVEAILRGGPADGRFMVVRDLREIDIMHLEEPGWGLRDFDPNDPFPTVPTKRYTYEPVRVLAEYGVRRVSP